jgi:thiosulfate/3-mercaptopyruvate sulfurtransferase
MRTLTFGIVALLATGLAAELALIQPNDVAAQLAAKGTHAVVFQVGPNLLYRGKHIPGAVYAGPGSRPEGLDLLKQAVDKLARDREIILYCGCCPWDNCPNVKPAMELLKQMGFTHAKAMYIETTFAKDWTDKGYPVEAGTAKQ